jgi:hypothetical protein
MMISNSWLISLQHPRNGYGPTVNPLFHNPDHRTLGGGSPVGNSRRAPAQQMRQQNPAVCATMRLSIPRRIASSLRLPHLKTIIEMSWKTLAEPTENPDDQTS